MKIENVIHATTGLSFEERKALTLQLAEEIRKLLLAREIPANVRCHFYRARPNLVCLYPIGLHYKSMTYWQQGCLKAGLQYSVRVWDERAEKCKHYATIYCS